MAALPGEALTKRLSILRHDNHLPARLMARDLATFSHHSRYEKPPFPT